MGFSGSLVGISLWRYHYVLPVTVGAVSGYRCYPSVVEA